MNAYRAILHIFSGSLRRHPATALATVASMAVGICVFVAIHLSGSAAQSSFISAVEAIAGKASHEITMSGGIPENRFSEIIQLDWVKHAQPIVEGRARVISIQRNGLETTVTASPLRLLGVDPFFVSAFLSTTSDESIIPPRIFNRFITEPRQIALPKPWADEAGVQEGDILKIGVAGHLSHIHVLQVYSLSVLGEAARDTAILDIASAQEILHRIGKIDRIDLIVHSESKQELGQGLLSGEKLERPRQRGERVAKMTEAFRLNLLALGALALLVGSLLIFNAAQYNVIRREGLLGQLRCLGVTKRQLLVATLLEVTMLGFLGGILGLLAGTLLAQNLVHSVAQTITNIYSFVAVERAPLEMPFAIAVLAGSIALSGLAGLFPALRTTQIQPKMVGLRSLKEKAYRLHLPRLSILSIAGFSGAIICIQLPINAWWPGLAAALGFLIGGAASLPIIMHFMLPFIQRKSEQRGFPTLSLAAGALHRSLSRTGSAAAALTASLSMTVGVIVMVFSFEMEVRQWIQTAIQADLYISDSASSVQREGTHLPEEALQIIRNTPGVRGVETLHGLEVPFGESSILFCGADWRLPESASALDIIDGPADALEKAKAGAVLISEPLANRYQKKVGDTLKIPGPNGSNVFTVAAIFRDFSYDRGFAITGIKPFSKIFGNVGIQDTRLYVDKGASPEATAARLRKALAGRFYLNVLSSVQLRTQIMEIFKATFAVTYLLQFIATLMALIGISITLLGLFLERGREIATIRALGSPISYVTKLFATESFLLAAFPIIMAIPLGAALAWVLIDIVNLRSFGWSIGFRWPWDTVLFTLGLSACAALLATWVPRALAKRQSISQALREE